MGNTESRQATATLSTCLSMAASPPPPPLAVQVATLASEVEKYKSEVDAFYLMWAGARVVAVLAPPLSHHRKGMWC